LQTKWKSPGKTATSERQAIVDPVDQQEAEDVHHHAKDNKLTSPLSLRRLSLPNRCCRGVDTIADAILWSAIESSTMELWKFVPRDDTSNHHMGHRERRGLKDSTDRHSGGANENRLFTAELLAHGEGRDGAEEATDCINGGDNGQDVGLRGAVEVVDGKVVVWDDNTAYAPSN
jgi:hypothetical protein